MVTRRELESALASARTSGERVAFFGALLARDSGLNDKLVIVGGSALSIYSGGVYVSKDIDVVAKRGKIRTTLRRWGFGPIERHGRRYWAREDLGLLLDVIDREDYVGLGPATRTTETPYGPVRIAAVEDLILRRLIFAKRARSTDLLNQAVLLWTRFGPGLDREYLEYHVGFEDVADVYREMLKRAGAPEAS